MATRKKHIDLRGTTRRDFIKYTTALGAFFGLERWRVFEQLGDIGGPALADSAACAITNRSVHVMGGSAGFAWFQLLWPQTYVADPKTFKASFAFHDSPNARYYPQGGAYGTDGPLMYATQTPWKNLPGPRQMSCFMAGNNEFGGTHNDAPGLVGGNVFAVDGNNNSMYSACAALQLANPTLVPVIIIDVPNGGGVGAGKQPYTPAVNGSPTAVRVTSGSQIVGLFDSAASAAMGPLSSPQSASLFEAYYKAFVGLQATANRPTYARGYATAKDASRIIGINLSSQLKPTNDDYVRYGVNPLKTASKLTDFATTLIITAKAFKLGLTSCVMMPAFNDDFHAGFEKPGEPLATITVIGATLDAFLADLKVPDPQCAGSTIADNLVMTFHSDTPKTPLIRADWPDATPGKCNWIYALGAGWLKTGWYGGVYLESGSAAVSTFDPATGAEVKKGNAGTNTTTAAAMPTAGAILYAVAKGDIRRVNDFYKGTSFYGIVRPKIM